MKLASLAFAGAGLIAAAPMPVRAADKAEDSPPARESELSVHLRTYYLDRERPAAADLKANTIGGWIGYDSGWFFDRIRFGLVGYTSQKIDAPRDEDGTLLLKPNQKSYGGFGELNARIRLWDENIFTGYRQKVFQPEVNPQDNRMTPNTFEGYTVAGKILEVNYYGGYIDKMKPRNATGFSNMARIASSTTDEKSGMWLGTLSYSPVKDLTLRYSGYHVPDILKSNYLDAGWLTPLSESLKLRLSGQYMFQSSTGNNALTGSSFDTWSGGGRADLMFGGATLRAGYTKTGKGANYLSPYGTWAGYTTMVVTDFNSAGQGAILLEGSYDFAAVKIPGLVFSAYGVFGNNQINPTSRAAVGDKKEYNGTVDYRFNGGGWPEWIKPLWLRARVTRIEQDQPGANAITKDYRFIVNYEQTFNW